MVKWTAHAKAQLRNIHDYIAADSPLYARRVSEALLDKTVGLDQLPRKGHKIPELNDETVREVSPYSIGLFTKSSLTMLFRYWP